MPPTTVITVDMSPQTRPSVTPAGSQSQQEHQTAKFKPTKTKNSYPIKLNTVYPRVLLLLTWALYLCMAVTVVNLGLLNISSFVWFRYDRAEDKFRAQSTTLYAEQILYGRLDKLLSSQLGRGFMESHENCLVRGLEKADHELLGLGFQYPSIRIQAMDWTMENCGRLQYTPQVVVPDPSPQQAVLTRWADVSYGSRRKLEKALEFMQQQASWIWARFLSAVSTANASTLTEHAPVSANTSNSRYHRRPLSEVPFGFTLRCEPSQPCRLFFPSTSTPSDKVSISPEALAKLKRESQELHSVYIYTHRALFVMLPVEIGLYSPCLLFAIFACWASSQPAMRPTHTPHRWRQEEKRLALYAPILPTLLLVKSLFAMYPGALPYDEAKGPFGLVMLLLGVSMLLQFFVVPSSGPKNVVHAYRLIKELCLIARGWEIPDEEDIDPETLIGTEMQVENPESKDIEDLPTDTKPDSSSSDHRQHNQSHKSHYRLASPITSLMEDLETRKKAFQEELKEVKTLHGVEPNVESDVDTDIDTESDSEPDTEDSSFVDLAGGVTPQLTDAGSGWSMVDA